MSSATLQLGGDNWAAKDGNLLGYQRSASSSVHIPHEFTFTRGSNLAATRVAANGLIEKGRENLLLQSNQFDTTWTLNSTSVTSGQAGYDGSNDAWLLNSTTTGFPRIAQNVTSSGVATYSVYVKPATDGFINMRTFGTDAAVWFNLNDGVVVNASGSQYVSSKIESVGDGWYRCSVIVNGSLTSLRIYPASSYGNYSTSGNGVYIQDAQLEAGMVATDYIETGAITVQAGLLEDEPRIDYTGGTGSLLLEPSRTNLVEYSEYFETTSWWFSTSADVELSDNTSPEGVKNAFKVTYGAGGNRLGGSNFGLPNTPHTNSIYMRKVSGSGVVNFADQLGDTNNITLTTDWERYDVTATLVDGTARFYIYLKTFGDVIEVYGAQQEEGSYPTSYIPNHSGGSVTRAADSSNITSGLSIRNGSEFGLYYEIDVDAIPRQSSSPFIQIQFSNANGGIGIKGASDALANYIDLYGTTDFSESFSARSMGSGVVKFFINYSSGTGDFYLNGTKYTGTISGPTSGCEIDSVYLLGSAYKLKAKQILIFPTALSDAECITRTTL